MTSSSAYNPNQGTLNDFLGARTANQLIVRVNALENQFQQLMNVYGIDAFHIYAKSVPVSDGEAKYSVPEDNIPTYYGSSFEILIPVLSEYKYVVETADSAGHVTKNESVYKFNTSNITIIIDKKEYTLAQMGIVKSGASNTYERKITESDTSKYHVYVYKYISIKSSDLVKFSKIISGNEYIKSITENIRENHYGMMYFRFLINYSATSTAFEEDSKKYVYTITDKYPVEGWYMRGTNEQLNNAIVGKSSATPTPSFSDVVKKEYIM